MSRTAIANAAEITPAGVTGLARWRALPDHASRYLAEHAVTMLELAIIFVWAAVVTRPYLTFDKMVVPSGLEYLYHISNNHIWTRAQECGLCALWNGSAIGGYPAFADLQTSALHPYVLLATLLFGVVNGAKIVLLLAFFTAGFSQWWLGRILGLSLPSRLWMALMAVAAGDLAGRMEGGMSGLVLSLAACSLAFTALVGLVRSGTRRSAVLFGITLALAALAGQGYVQVGLVFLLPLVLVLIVGGRVPVAVLARRFGLSLGLAFLLAAPLILPALHFLPQFAKHTDPDFGSAQPLRFIVLNLLVNDPAYYRTEILGKLAFPSVYANFIGWIPFVLALWGVASRQITGSVREGIFFFLTALGALWLASAVPLKWLAHAVPVPALQNFIYGVRFSPFLIGLAVPAILALAGIGLERVLRAPWPQFDLRVSASGNGPANTLRLDLRWLLIIPLVWALREAYAFGRQYISNTRLGPDVALGLDVLQTPDLQWVNTPFGEWYWIESAIARNMKVSVSTQPWSWEGRESPLAVRELSRRAEPPPGMTLAGQVNSGLNLFVAGPGREYAVVTGSDGLRTICQAHGIGGDIDVTCDSPAGGELTVEENFWAGWQARVDGRPAQVGGDRFITVPVPAGAHTVTLRYRPLDALLGIVLCLLGIVLCCYFWIAKDQVDVPPPEAA